MNHYIKVRRKTAIGLAIMVAVILAVVTLLGWLPVMGQALSDSASRGGYQVARSGYEVARSGYEVARSGYDLSWWTVDGGGDTGGSSGAYTLGGTIGQPDAGVLAAGAYTLNSGFWAGVGKLYRVYLPLVPRQ